MERELDVQELKYSMGLHSSNQNDDKSSESSKFQEDFVDTQELSYSVDLSDLSESDQSESNKSIPELCFLRILTGKKQPKIKLERLRKI